MRDLTSDDLGNLMALFAVLLLAFAANFQLSRKVVRRHRRTALFSVIVTVIALLLTWVAIWSPSAWEQIDDMLVLVPGSLAILCAVVLTVESVIGRALTIIEVEREDRRKAEQQNQELPEVPSWIDEVSAKKTPTTTPKTGTERV
ncbi:MAG: hypothetical protein QM774_06315 [Gordonia sp. (in: high G+C Gram-positive bacteria)]|uniref:hypothetical protein n=1 Tax=Gordonia sp. (in: high G+C Gram-positive bacteria) TaxID=84139 RepID=UPI0039E64471